MIGIRKEERPIALIALIVFALLNGLLIYNHYDSFTRGAHVGFWSVFYNHLNMSGYDVFSLIFISCMRLHWDAMRHPLFVAVLLPLYWLNHWLMPQTEFNFAVFLMAAVLVACDVWSVVLMHRILRDIVGCSRIDSVLLTALFYGFAHVMVASMVPDHFALSLPLLLLTLLLAGRKLQEGSHAQKLLPPRERFGRKAAPGQLLPLAAALVVRLPCVFRQRAAKPRPVAHQHRAAAQKLEHTAPVPCGRRLSICRPRCGAAARRSRGSAPGGGTNAGAVGSTAGG